MGFIDTFRQNLADQAPADKYVVWVVLGLAAVGVVAVYSAVTYLAEVRAGTEPVHFLANHLIRVTVALGVMWGVSLIDYRTLARYSQIALLGALVLLVAVKIAGFFSPGTDRWLQIAGVGFQPSELARVALVFYVAILLVKKQEYVKSFSRTILPILVWVVLTVGLIGLDDLSTALVLLGAVGLMSVVGRVSMVQIVGLGALGVMMTFGVLSTSPDRAARMEAYLGMDVFSNTDTEQVMDAKGEQYQSRQARMALAVGGITGVGPGKSVQRDFLPAPYNDFIFAIIAEEYGIVGALALLFGFCVLLFRGYLRIARDAPDPLGLFLAVGFTTLIVTYGFVHAGVACGLLPVTGLPMPFVSYGGTSLLANGIMGGVLLNISRHAG
ncbi:MAG: cell division protein FtsW [Bacteroidetes bacterium QS_3_64_15]|nr:MAG: cell division protein FtsW [Bacteroidetes bacterium QS_3_64_15]